MFSSWDKVGKSRPLLPLPPVFSVVGDGVRGLLFFFPKMIL